MYYLILINKIHLLILGEFEIVSNYLTTIIISVLIYNIINSYFCKNLLKRFQFFKITRRDFYECGFRPQNQKPIKLPIQFLLICIFFLLYDIELIFLFPYISNISYIGFFDLLLLLLFFSLFLISLFIDYNKHALYWQY